LDLSLVADSPIHPANFCQLDGSLPEPLLWRDHAVLSAAQGAIAVEVFHPKLSAGGLDNRFFGPQAAGRQFTPAAAQSYRRSMPEASPSELLASFLRMRDQVCIDLGISPLKDDTLEAYMAKVQRTAFEMRDAVQQKHFAIALAGLLPSIFADENSPGICLAGRLSKSHGRAQAGYAVAYGAKS
jgi:hypothetical protein